MTQLADRALCSFCHKERIIAGDVVVHFMAFLGEVTTPFRMTFKNPLCRHCMRYVRAGGQPNIHLASGGIQKRLTQRQKRLEVLAHKRRERLAKQQELDYQGESSEYGEGDGEE